MTAGSGYFYFFSLLRGLGDGSCSLQSGLSFLSDAGQQFLDLSDGAARVETLRTGLGAVHDGVTSVMSNECVSARIATDVRKGIISVKSF